LIRIRYPIGRLVQGKYAENAVFMRVVGVLQGRLVRLQKGSSGCPFARAAWPSLRSLSRACMRVLAAMVLRLNR